METMTMKRLTGILAAAALGLAAPAWGHVHVPGLDVNGQCVGDQDGDAAVAINELILAVNNSLQGCAVRPVELQFRATVGDEDFACGQTYSGIGTGAGQLVPADFRFYIHDVHLVSNTGDEVPVTLEQDGEWQYQNAVLLDFEDGSGPCATSGNAPMNALVRGTVPAGVYVGVTYKLGLPFDLNHGDATNAPPPLNSTSMFWVWRSGYKFVRIDTADDKFRVHLGSTGCTGGGALQPPTSCASPNRAEISLSGFNPDHSVIAADLKALLSASDVDANEPDTPPGCMSDPNDAECPAIFAAFGLEDGLPHAGQRFFRLDSHHSDDDHKEIVIAADGESGGALVAHAEFDTTAPIPLAFSDCFGGTGDDCAGGQRLFTAVNPGLSPLAESEPEQSRYTIAAGAPITLTVSALAEGLSFRLGQETLDGVGDSVVLGTTPDFHADLEAQLLIPADAAATAYAATFSVSTTAAGYTASAPLTVLFKAAASQGGGDDHGHE